MAVVIQMRHGFGLLEEIMRSIRLVACLGVVTTLDAVTDPGPFMAMAMSTVEYKKDAGHY